MQINTSNMSADQLRQASVIQREIEALQAKLAKVVGVPQTATRNSNGTTPKRVISPEGRARIAAAQKARWAAVAKAKAAKA